MPYTIKQARSSDFYKNVQDSDEQKQLKKIQEETQRAAISGSALDATDPLRDEKGFLLSFEDPQNPGSSYEKPYQYVRLAVVQKSSNRELFSEFFEKEDNTGKADFQELGISQEVESEGDTTQPELEGLRIELENKIAAQDELNTTLNETITELQEELAKVATEG